MIPYGKQDINQADIDAVVEVLRSDFLTTGPAVNRFEQAVANYCGAQHAVAVANATAGLHLACLALGVGKGDIVWTSPNTFVASANCALYCGAMVDFVDICPKTYNMSVDALAEKLAYAKQNNCLPKVVIPVHFSGQSCDMQAIKMLANEYGFHIIEDASHAIGGRYLNKPIGSCEFSDITIFSFHPVKIITTGEGGLVLTNNTEIADKVNLLRTHGVTRDVDKMQGLSDGAWYYQQIDLGFNYRITDLQCALGLSQLKRLDSFVARRNDLAKKYNMLLKNLPLVLPAVKSDTNYSAFHLYVIQIDEQKTPTTRLQVFNFLRQNGIGVNVHYIPVHTQPYYRCLGFLPGQFPQAEQYYARAISIPMYSKMTDAEQITVAQVLERAFSEIPVGQNV